jgi:hypothetical protein
VAVSSAAVPIVVTIIIMTALVVISAPMAVAVMCAANVVAMFAFADVVAAVARWNDHYWRTRNNYRRPGYHDGRRRVPMMIANGNPDRETACLGLLLAQARDEEHQETWNEELFHTIALS